MWHLCVKIFPFFTQQELLELSLGKCYTIKIDSFQSKSFNIVFIKFGRYLDTFALRTSHLHTLGYLSPSSYKSRFISPHYPLAFIFNNVCCYFHPCRTTTFNGLPSCCASNRQFPVRQRRVSFQSYWHSTSQDAYVPTQSIWQNRVT